MAGRQLAWLLLLVNNVPEAAALRLSPVITKACCTASRPALVPTSSGPAARRSCAPLLMADEGKRGKGDDEEGWTLDKVAKLGLAGVLSIAVAETVFWVLSFPVSAIVYYVATGEWIDLFTQDGQVKFLAFTAGWGALGGAIAQYRTVLTAAAMTPWSARHQPCSPPAGPRQCAASLLSARARRSGPQRGAALPRAAHR